MRSALMIKLKSLRQHGLLAVLEAGCPEGQNRKSNHFSSRPVNDWFSIETESHFPRTSSYTQRKHSRLHPFPIR